MYLPILPERHDSSLMELWENSSGENNEQIAVLLENEENITEKVEFF